jgi:cysteine desulfurase
MRRGLSLQPLWYGGGQELGLRSGTEPVPSIAGLAAASRLARTALASHDLASHDHIRALRDRLESSILARIEDTSVNGVTQPRLGNTANIAFHGAYADLVVRAIDAEGVCVSAGAACHSGNVEPSSTMKAMGMPLHIAMGAVRFSLSRYTTEAEIDRAVEIVADTLPRVRQETAAAAQ